MRTHPALGHDLLQSIGFLSGAAEVVLHHHERFDGSGYPAGLKGDQIALGARIFSVVDALDVITTNRPYSRGKGWRWAKEEIQRCAHSQFDPEVVAAFIRVPEEEWRAIQGRFIGPNERARFEIVHSQ